MSESITVSVGDSSVQKVQVRHISFPRDGNEFAALLLFISTTRFRSFYATLSSLDLNTLSMTGTSQDEPKTRGFYYIISDIWSCQIESNHFNSSRFLWFSITWKTQYVYISTTSPPYRSTAGIKKFQSVTI